MCRGKSTAKDKLKAINQEKRIHLWKQHFENLLGKSPKVMHKPITEIIINQFDIKLGQFTQEKLDSVNRKFKDRKAVGLDEIPPEVWKTMEFYHILFRHWNAVYNKNTTDRCTKGWTKKGDLGIAKNYIHSGQDLQWSTKQTHITQNRKDP